MYSETSADVAGADRTGIPGYLDFDVSVIEADGLTIVRVSGDLDCYSAPRLRATLSALVADGPRHVVLDIGGTNFIDSTGLGVLVGGVKRFHQGGGDMVLSRPNATTRRLFEITGVTKLFEIV